MTIPKNIVVVTHEASLTGAPILLLNLLNSLKKRFQFNYFIIIVKDGPLQNAFLKLGPGIVLKKANYRKGETILQQMISVVKSRLRLFQAVLATRRYDLILSNTLVTGMAISKLKLLKKPTLVYAHELQSVFTLFQSRNVIKPLIDERFVYLYPSAAVKMFLADTLKLPVERMQELHYLIPDDTDAATGFWQTSDRLNPDKGCRICGMGVASPRKGTDLFIQAAAVAHAKNKSIRFEWIGRFESADWERRYRKLVKELALESCFHFTGELHPAEAQRKLAQNNLLFLSSREDPYPLVVLEAAKYAIPSVVFATGGGITEFVTEQNGWVVEEMSENSAGTLLAKIRLNALPEKGLKAREKYLIKHTNEERIAAQFTAALDKL